MVPERRIPNPARAVCRGRATRGGGAGGLRTGCHARRGGNRHVWWHLVSTQFGQYRYRAECFLHVWRAPRALVSQWISDCAAHCERVDPQRGFPGLDVHPTPWNEMVGRSTVHGGRHPLLVDLGYHLFRGKFFRSGRRFSGIHAGRGSSRRYRRSGRSHREICIPRASPVLSGKTRHRRR